MIIRDVSADRSSASARTDIVCQSAHIYEIFIWPGGVQRTTAQLHTSASNYCSCCAEGHWAIALGDADMSTTQGLGRCRSVFFQNPGDIVASPDTVLQRVLSQHDKRGIPFYSATW